MRHWALHLKRLSYESSMRNKYRTTIPVNKAWSIQIVDGDKTATSYDFLKTIRQLPILSTCEWIHGTFVFPSAAPNFAAGILCNCPLRPTQNWRMPALSTARCARSVIRALHSPLLPPMRAWPPGRRPRTLLPLLRAASLVRGTRSWTAIARRPL